MRSFGVYRHKPSFISLFLLPHPLPTTHHPITFLKLIRKMSTAPYALEKSVAISGVLKASLIAQKVQKELIGSGGVTKADKSPVTGSPSLSSS